MPVYLSFCPYGVDATEYSDSDLGAVEEILGYVSLFYHMCTLLIHGDLCSESDYAGDNELGMMLRYVYPLLTAFIRLNSSTSIIPVNYNTQRGPAPRSRYPTYI